jgi:predicted trehalose synthase
VAITTTLDIEGVDAAWAAWWSRAVSTAFVRGYVAAMEDSPLIPHDPEAIDALLNAYAMSRALREVHWELTARPGWVAVPLAGVRRMLGEAPSLVR